MPSPRRLYTRVAVVQLHYQPAALIQRRSLLEEPLAAFVSAEGLLPPDSTLPLELVERYRALRQRIRQTYDDQLLQRLQAILRACQEWKVRLVVFPEYSIPWEILEGVADAAGDMVVVAGTHTVELRTHDAGIYERLGLATVPAPGLSICPILYQQRLFALQPKLNLARQELGSMRPGETWQAVTLPDGLPGPMGVLICLDFLDRGSPISQSLVATHLNACRFLAVPSLTPSRTIEDFANKAWDDARRNHRPVFYANIASGGGTSIYVDNGASTDLRHFPEQVGYLEPGEEGVIVADVDLGYEPTGSSRMYANQPAVVPVAAASLVYGCHPVEATYTTWLSALSPLLAKDDTESLRAAIFRTEAEGELLRRAGALSGAAMRQRRLQRLLVEARGITGMEDIRRFTREVRLPSDVLPLADLQAALAGAAADVLRGWIQQHGSSGLTKVETRLRTAGKPVEATDAALWTDAGRQALTAVVQSVREPTPESRSEALVLLKMVGPSRLMTTSGWSSVGRARLDTLRGCIEGIGTSYGLSCISFRGNGYLLAFYDAQNLERAAVHAFRATLALAREIDRYNVATTPERRINLRFALHYGTVGAVIGNREGRAVTYTFHMEDIQGEESRKAPQDRLADMSAALPTLPAAVPGHSYALLSAEVVEILQKFQVQEVWQTLGPVKLRDFSGWQEISLIPNVNDLNP